MKITKNFTLEELSHSNTAKAKGIKNEPNKEQVQCLIDLAINVLQPLRDIWGKQIIINSGFRSQEANKAVGGVLNSQHTKGQAADLHVDNPRELMKKLTSSNIVFDQAILYQDGRNNFLHVSYNKEKNRNQILFSKGTEKI